MSTGQKFDIENLFIGLVRSNSVRNEKTSKNLKKKAIKHCFLTVFWRLLNSNQIWGHQTNIFIYSIKFLIAGNPRDFWVRLNSGYIIFGKAWTLLCHCVLALHSAPMVRTLIPAACLHKILKCQYLTRQLSQLPLLLSLIHVMELITNLRVSKDCW